MLCTALKYLIVAGICSFPGFAQYPPSAHSASQFGAVVGFGDSLMFGVGSSSPPKRFINLLAYDYGLVLRGAPCAGPCVNLGQGADQAADQADAILGRDIPSYGSQLVVDNIGNNDLYRYRSLTAGIVWYRSVLEAEALWIVAKDKVPSQQARCTGKGLFDSPNYGGRIEIASSTPRVSPAPGVRPTVDACTFVVHGSVIYFVSTQSDGGSGQTTIAVDGRPVGIVKSAPPNGITINTRVYHRTYAPVLIRIPGLAPGPHALTVTNASAPGGSVLWTFAAGNESPGADGSPLLVIDGVPKQNPYWTGCGHPNCPIASDPVTQAQDEANRAVAFQLAGDGFRVGFADVRAHQVMETDFNNTSPLGNVHPNDLGMTHYAQAIEEAAQNTDLRPSPQ